MTTNNKATNKIDWEEQFGFLKEGVDYLMEESKKDRKKIRELEKELLEAQTKIIETEDFRIGLNFDLNHHWWEYSDGTEGGELILKHNQRIDEDGTCYLSELIDYDGTSQLGTQILDALHQNGINVLKMKYDEAKENYDKHLTQSS